MNACYWDGAKWQLRRNGIQNTMLACQRQQEIIGRIDSISELRSTGFRLVLLSFPLNSCDFYQGFSN